MIEKLQMVQKRPLRFTSSNGVDTLGRKAALPNIFYLPCQQGYILKGKKILSLEQIPSLYGLGLWLKIYQVYVFPLRPPTDNTIFLVFASVLGINNSLFVSYIQCQSKKRSHCGCAKLVSRDHFWNCPKAQMTLGHSQIVCLEFYSTLKTVVKATKYEVKQLQI